MTNGRSQRIDTEKDHVETEVLGGHEFLAKYPNYDAASLNEFWISKKSVKLRSGFYFQNYLIEGTNCLLVNGFHPEQLQHFINPSHKIVILLLHSNVSWKLLKDKLAGDTFPEKADANSIRGELYENSAKYGIGGVSISNNFIHLSAGPFEALFEIRNFLSNVIPDRFDIFECNLFNKLMLKGVSKESIDRSLKNPKLAMDSKNTDLFTITENLNTDEAISNFNNFLHK